MCRRKGNVNSRDVIVQSRVVPIESIECCIWVESTADD